MQGVHKFGRENMQGLSTNFFEIYGVFNDGDSTEYLIFVASYNNCKQHKIIKLMLLTTITQQVTLTKWLYIVQFIEYETLAGV